jgi:hypothetical protein
MIVTTIKPNEPSFGYSNVLKTMYKQGKLPIKYGIYGGKLNKKNISLEHLRCVSEGGSTTLDNLALATKENNNARGTKPLWQCLTPEMVVRYLNQFVGIRIPNKFNGNEYINNIIKTLNSLGVFF